MKRPKRDQSEWKREKEIQMKNNNDSDGDENNNNKKCVKRHSTAIEKILAHTRLTDVHKSGKRAIGKSFRGIFFPCSFLFVFSVATIFCRLLEKQKQIVKTNSNRKTNCLSSLYLNVRIQWVAFSPVCIRHFCMPLKTRHTYTLDTLSHKNITKNKWHYYLFRYFSRFSFVVRFFRFLLLCIFCVLSLLLLAAFTVRKRRMK